MTLLGVISSSVGILAAFFYQAWTWRKKPLRFAAAVRYKMKLNLHTSGSDRGKAFILAIDQLKAVLLQEHQVDIDGLPEQEFQWYVDQLAKAIWNNRFTEPANTLYCRNTCPNPLCPKYEINPDAITSHQEELVSAIVKPVRCDGLSY